MSLNNIPSQQNSNLQPNQQNATLQPNQQNTILQYNQQMFLEHAAFAAHFERLKTANAANDVDYYMYAELEYYHRSRAFHYKGLFSASSTVIQQSPRM